MSVPVLIVTVSLRGGAGLCQSIYVPARASLFMYGPAQHTAQARNNTAQHGPTPSRNDTAGT